MSQAPASKDMIAPKNRPRFSLPRHKCWLITISGLFVALCFILVSYRTRLSFSREPGIEISDSAGPSPNAEFPAKADQYSGPETIILHPEDHAFRKPRTLHLSWVITQDDKSPDGVSKKVLQVNGQFPGPVIEARSGDELVVDVRNEIAGDKNNSGLSIHWHGLTMEGANEMDGVVGLTQCAIAPGHNFTYHFRLSHQQAGTFWYHAHSGVQKADGLYGGLVVHKPADKSEEADQALHDYTTEQLLLIGDWYHRPGADVLKWYSDPDHYGMEVSFAEAK